MAANHRLGAGIEVDRIVEVFYVSHKQCRAIRDNMSAGQWLGYYRRALEAIDDPRFVNGAYGLSEDGILYVPKDEDVT